MKKLNNEQRKSFAFGIIAFMIGLIFSLLVILTSPLSNNKKEYIWCIEEKKTISVEPNGEIKEIITPINKCETVEE